MRRVYSDAAISATVLVLLVAGLAIVDPRVREHAASFIGTPGSSSAAGVGAQLADVASAVVIAVRDQSVAHAPMMVFVVVAAVLFVAMLRS